MKINALRWAWVLLAFSFACKSADNAPAQERSASVLAATVPATAAPEAEVQKLGAPLSAGEAVAVSHLVAGPDAFKDKSVIVAGTIKATCKRSGCWMELADADDGSAHFRVTFKDHAFIAPKDCIGKSAKVEGVVAVESLAKDRVEHMEAMGATFPSKQPDGSVQQLSLVATGMELRRN